jgi:hypothetical protein
LQQSRRLQKRQEAKVLPSVFWEPVVFGFDIGPLEFLIAVLVVAAGAYVGLKVHRNQQARYESERRSAQENGGGSR